jgi:predicted cupin superfamily sugar epimerase
VSGAREMPASNSSVILESGAFRDRFGERFALRHARERAAAGCDKRRRVPELPDRDHVVLPPDARELVRLLRLEPHPEGGFYRETWRSPLSLAGLVQRDARAASTAIYFLLPAGTFSALHRVASDEVWHHYDGDPVDLHELDDLGNHSVTTLGRALQAGERPQHVVPAKRWQAAVPRGDRYALCGCTVAPGFDFADFEMPSRAEMMRIFPAHAELIERLSRP